MDALLDAAEARFGRVDAVVHSAAVLAYGRFTDVPAEVFDRTLEVTLGGTATVARAALRRFEAQGSGRLVVVGSLLGKIATPYMSSYVTAKWAVHGLVRCLQIEARGTPGIQVSLVSPGGVNTPVYVQAGTYAGRHGMPPPPVVSPERVARTIARRLDQPARDTDVGPANLVTVLGFRLLPGVFDLIVTPLMKAGGLQRTSGRHRGQRPRAGCGGGGHPRAVGHRVRRGLRRRPRRRAHGSVRSEAVVAAGLTPSGVTEVVRHVEAPADAVWAVLADGWLYANWVVGASRVRAVDLTWPAAGSALAHSFGVWPAVVSDESRVLEAEPGRRLVIQAQGWPLGEARVELTIEAVGRRDL